jgi:hypothetical protein
MNESVEKPDSDAPILSALGSGFQIAGWGGSVGVSVYSLFAISPRLIVIIRRCLAYHSQVSPC